MDRNAENPMIRVDEITSLSARRAWIEIPITSPTTNCFKSLSARRAWIEIRRDIRPAAGRPVALRKESVDRNSYVGVMVAAITPSLSARRAWIEMPTRC